MSLVCAMAAPSLDSLSLSLIITVSLSISETTPMSFVCATVAPSVDSLSLSLNFTVALSLSQKWRWRHWRAPWIHFHFYELSRRHFHFHRNDADVVGVRHGCSFTGFTFTLIKFHCCTFTFTEMTLTSLESAMDSLSLLWIITVSLSLSQKRCWCRWCAPWLHLHWIHFHFH